MVGVHLFNRGTGTKLVGVTYLIHTGYAHLTHLGTALLVHVVQLIIRHYSVPLVALFVEGATFTDPRQPTLGYGYL